MGYEKIVPPPPPPHVCSTPWMIVVIMQNLGIGSQWRCDGCRQLWVLCGDGPRNPTKWETVPDGWGMEKEAVSVKLCPLCLEPVGDAPHRQGGVWQCAGRSTVERLS